MQAVKHVHADLIKEYARQYADGEIEAGWWKWEYRPQNYNTWEPASGPSWSATKEYRFSKTEKHPDFDSYISPGDSFEIVRERKAVVTMHLAGVVNKVCFTDQSGRYFPGVFNITEFAIGIFSKVPVSVIEKWINEKIIKETIVKCNQEYN